MIEILLFLKTIWFIDVFLVGEHPPKNFASNSMEYYTLKITIVTNDRGPFYINSIIYILIKKIKNA